MSEFNALTPLTTPTLSGVNYPRIQVSAKVLRKLVQSIIRPEPYELAYLEAGMLIENLHLSLATSTVNRLFSYLENTAKQDLQPTATGQIVADTDYSKSNSVTPEIDIALFVDRSLSPPVLNLTLQINNLALPYSDEVLTRAKAYVLETVAQDMNP